MGVAALCLSGSDRELIDLVARHPFLPTRRLAIALDWPPTAL